MKKYVYVVCQVERKKLESVKGRGIAIFTSKRDAVKAVVNNQTDIWEKCYNYARIYKVPVGFNYGVADGYSEYRYDAKSQKYKHYCDKSADDENENEPLSDFEF